MAVPRAGRGRLTICGADGRVVRVLLDGAVEPGTREVAWDGRDASGREAAGGVYFCCLSVSPAGAADVLVRKIVLAR